MVAHHTLCVRQICNFKDSRGIWQNEYVKNEFGEEKDNICAIKK
jgi:hypothetical protein